MAYHTDKWANRKQEADVRSAVRAWGIDAQEVRAVSGGFSGAAVFRVDTADDRRFAARAIPSSTATSLKRQTQIMQMLAFIHQSGMNCVAAPRQLRAASHALPPVASPVNAWFSRQAKRLWQVSLWRDGSPVGKTELDPDRAAAAIGIVHEFHALAYEWAERHNSDELTPRDGPSLAVLKRRQILQTLADGELSTLSTQIHRLSSPLHESSEQLVGVLRRHLPKLIQDTESAAAGRWRLQPVIRDLWKQHVLFTESRVTGLVDFWECASDHVFVDFSRLFRSWAGADNILVSRLWRETLRGHLIRQADRQLLDVLDACTVLLSPLTWLRRFLTSESDQFSPQAVNRFQALVDVAASFRPFEMELR